MALNLALAPKNSRPPRRYCTGPFPSLQPPFPHSLTNRGSPPATYCYSATCSPPILGPVLEVAPSSPPSSIPSLGAMSAPAPARRAHGTVPSSTTEHSRRTEPHGCLGGHQLGGFGVKIINTGVKMANITSAYILYFNEYYRH